MIIIFLCILTERWICKHHFLLSSTDTRKKALDSPKISIFGFWCLFMFWDVQNTIWLFFENLCLSVYLSAYMYVSKILWTLYFKNLCLEIDETLYSVAPCYILLLIRFWCISLEKSRCCSKFMISFLWLLLDKIAINCT